jgi:hypothetical protein
VLLNEALPIAANAEKYKKAQKGFFILNMVNELCRDLSAPSSLAEQLIEATNFSKKVDEDEGVLIGNTSAAGANKTLTDARGQTV